MQSNEADELARLSLFDRPEAPTSLVYELRDSLDKCIAFVPGPSRRVIAHDIGIRIHRRERLKVGLTPLSELQAWSDEFSGVGHGEDYGNRRGSAYPSGALVTRECKARSRLP